MLENALILLMALVATAVLGQWLAWRFELPAILVLFSFGLLFGDLATEAFASVLELAPLAKLTTALILFERGLDFRRSDLKMAMPVLVRITLGSLLLGGLGAGLLLHTFFSIDWGTSLVFGVLFASLGASSTGHILRRARPIPRVGGLIRREAIISEPLGAIISLMLLSFVLKRDLAIWEWGLTIGYWVLGGVLGVAVGVLLIRLMRGFSIPEQLQNPTVFALGAVLFLTSELLQNLSSLLSLFAFGAVLGNQTKFNLQQLMLFKEEMRTLVVSTLCVALSAGIYRPLSLELVTDDLVVALTLVLVLRPISVLLFSSKSRLDWGDRLLLCFAAPRGVLVVSLTIVLVSVLPLASQIVAQRIVLESFLLVFVSVLSYSFFVPVIVRIFKLKEKGGRGVLIVGAHPWAREFALALQEVGVTAALVDTNGYNISAARRDGLVGYQSNIFLDVDNEEIPLTNIGKLLAMTSNDEVNTLAALHYSRELGRENVFQLLPGEGDKGGARRRKKHRNFGLRVLFSPDLSYRVLDALFLEGAKVEVFNLNREFTLQNLLGDTHRTIIPFAVVSQSGELLIAASDQPLKAFPGSRIVCLVKEN